MPVYYFDTSAFVKLYVREAGSPEVVALTDNLHDDKLAVLDLAGVEAKAAVRKRQRMGDLSAAVAGSLLLSLAKDLSEWFLVQPSNGAVVDEALGLLDRYPLKAYDAMQLAGCIVLAAGEEREVTLVSSDRQLLSAARGEGVAVINPEGGA
ncbi:MAG: type II toxin-antitoxin system VapC family toxin [Acidobacteria bacterium]|nr:type II toxin-antitoxin system VapC family toxin [Acidobacteriota bacterium]